MQAKTRGLDPGTEGKKLRKGDTKDEETETQIRLQTHRHERNFTYRKP